MKKCSCGSEPDLVVYKDKFNHDRFYVLCKNCDCRTVEAFEPNYPQTLWRHGITYYDWQQLEFDYGV